MMETLTIYIIGNLYHYSTGRLQELDTHAKVALTAHSLSAYVSTLDDEHLKKFTSKIISDCELWLSRLFRYSF